MPPGSSRQAPCRRRVVGPGPPLAAVELSVAPQQSRTGSATQVYQPGAGLDFHFDKDEELFKQQAVMQQPRHSMIYYLYGDPESGLGMLPAVPGCTGCWTSSHQPACRPHGAGRPALGQ